MREKNTGGNSLSARCCHRDVVIANKKRQSALRKNCFERVEVDKKSFREREKGPKTDKSGVKTDKNGKIRASQRRSPNRGKGAPLKREEENLSGNKRFSERAENVDRES